MNLPTDERLLVGIDTADDAGVLRLSEHTALILTVDFFSPVVDDPYAFGAIAAANALSDVYAMGGRPLAALNIAAFPEKGDKNLLRRVLQGGADKVAEAGAVIAGGHSVRDDELKFGLAVVGEVHPERVITNAGAQPGDVLILTKLLGTGILATARRRDAITEDDFVPAVKSMLQLNREAAEAMQEVGVHACTDITGFGLIGHAQEMACASGVGIRLYPANVPLLPRTREGVEKGWVPGGLRKNREHFGTFVEVMIKKKTPSSASLDALFDPQTSGGLLISLAPEKAHRLLSRLEAKETPVAVIGEVLNGPKGRIVVQF